MVTKKRNGVRFVRDKRTITVNARDVASSNVEWIAWPTTGEPLMIVTYKSGGVYGYIGVSRQRAVAAAYSSSVGGYINNRVKGRFRPVRF